MPTAAPATQPPSSPLRSPSPALRGAATAAPSALPWNIVRALARHRHLIGQLTRRDVLARYRGSYLGILWSVLNPLFMLAIFATVFGLIFQGKFTGHPSESPVDFALQLFAGLIVFNVFAECLGRAPSLMLLNGNYVTKVVFPLEILPVTVVLNALVNLLFSVVPLVLAVAVFRHHLPATLALWPLLLVPLCLFSLGTAWLLSALGVFFRDLSELVGPLSLVIMYASAIFYPVEAVRAKVPWLEPVLRLNPLAYLATESRNLAIWGEGPDWPGYGIILGVSLLFACLGYALFTRMKGTFADVL